MTSWTPNARLPVLTGHIWRNQRGTAAVEFALVSTLLIFLFTAATDIALAIWAGQQVGNAARAGSEYAAINTAANGYNSSAISTAATSATTRSGVTATSSNYCGNASASGVTQTCILPCSCTVGGTTGTYVSVTASSSYAPILPALWGTILTNNALNLSATSVTRIN
jgi:Flp pilus assembly protein TadG